jgi:hypothetical protein
LSAEQEEQIKALPITALEELEEALWELTTMPELEAFLSK